MLRKFLLTLLIACSLAGTPACASTYFYYSTQSIYMVRDKSLQPKPPSIAKLISEASLRHGVDVALIHAVVRAESGYDHRAISPAGARGLMGLMPSTARTLGVRNIFLAEDNLDGGVSYLRQLIEQFKGNVSLALAGYNAGPAAVVKYGRIPPYGETRAYVRRVLQYRAEFVSAHG